MGGGPGADALAGTDHGAFFGRRKGKALRTRQSQLVANALPRLRLDLSRPAPADLAPLFARAVDAVHLEIGYGGGEHLAMRAEEAPSTGFIGCEAFVNGTAKLLALAERAGLGNLRLWDDDAKSVVDWLPPASIDRAYILYPDPWPKRRHRKRRFLQAEMLERIARILKPGAELCFATDVDDYAAFVLARVARSPSLEWMARSAGDWLVPWPEWPGTRYERKAIAAGRLPTYLTFRRITNSS
jgi:tRNA (guanine-N7-)-methyltransferase